VRYQLTLENVTNWLAIPKFQELRGKVALAIVASTSARQCKEFSNEGSFELAVTNIESNRRGDYETFEVIDDTMVERTS